MKFTEIPMDFSNSGYVTQHANVAGVMFEFRFLFNQRDGFMYCDFKTNGGERLGVKLVPETRLLDSTSGLFDGSGYFALLRTSAMIHPTDVSLFDLGNGWNLYFVEEDGE